MKMEGYFSNNIYKCNKKNKMEDFDLKKYLAEGKLLKEEIMVDTNVMVDPNNTLMSNISDEEIDYIKANITNVPKMPVEDFMRKYDEYLDRFYDEADPLDGQIKALQIHIDKGVLTREEAMEALAVLQGQDIEDYEDTFLAEGRLLKEDYTQKKYTEEEWKRELDLNVEMAARLIDYQANGGSWQDLMTDLIAMQKRSIITGSDIKFFIEWIESQEDNKLPNMSSGSFFTGLTDVDGLLSAMNFENEDENGEELYTDEEYEAAQKYHTDKINQLDWTKY